ncbi:MAG: hypothetical protein Fur009_7630 [Candidatus Microgenomates bacterium]
MGKKRAEIATVLTLVLMVVGVVASVLTANLVNKNKLATNSRASLQCPSTEKCFLDGQVVPSNYIRTSNECIIGSKEGLCYKIKSTKTPTPTAPKNGNSLGPCCGFYCQGNDVKSKIIYNNITSDNSGIPIESCDGDKAYDNKYILYLCSRPPNIICNNGEVSLGGSGSVQPSLDSSPARTNNNILKKGEKCCFKKNGKIYVFADYNTMVNSQMVNENGEPDCGRQSDAVISSYQADQEEGAFVCSGIAETGMSVDQYYEAIASPTPPPKPPPGCTTPILINQKIKTCSRGGGVLINDMWCCSPTSTPPPPGSEGGSCKNLYRAVVWYGECDENLFCDGKTGKCVKPSSTPPPEDETGTTRADTITSGQEKDCPPPAFCSIQGNLGGWLTCGSGFYDYKVDGQSITCYDKDGKIGKCCLPKPTSVIISQKIPTPTNYTQCENHSCIDLCLILSYPFSENYNAIVSKSNRYYPYSTNANCINEGVDAREIINFCGCTKNIDHDLFQSQEDLGGNLIKACYDEGRKYCVVYSIKN